MGAMFEVARLVPRRLRKARRDDARHRNIATEAWTRLGPAAPPLPVKQFDSASFKRRRSGTLAT